MGGKVVFGVGLETEVSEAEALRQHATAADQAGLDLVSLSDHPYLAGRLDAYAALGVVLGGAARVSGLVNVTNLPSRPVPMLARTISALSALSGGRIVAGLGAGGLWDEIAKLGVRTLSPAAAVRALEEGIVLLRALFGGGAPVDFDGEFYQVKGLEPTAVAAPPVWTGSNGPKSLAVTGRVADGWIPGHAADWRSARVAGSRPIIDEAAIAVGRAPSDVATIYNVTGRITERPLAATRDADGRWLGGSAAQWADELTTAVVDHGAAGFIHHRVNDPTPAGTTLARWATEIVPAVRETLARI
jgi:alkanesulfonate monooxygenase SsuD/methylene tetrahydromethanopterin reductase-like flavin-dependent oxidoreductase (luciferase family)